MSLVGEGVRALSPTPPMHRAPPYFFSGGNFWKGISGLYRVSLSVLLS
nr:MAG TPA: hypothetical protein [Caudoviricetes sp.]